MTIRSIPRIKCSIAFPFATPCETCVAQLLLPLTFLLLLLLGIPAAAQNKSSAAKIAALAPQGVVNKEYDAEKELARLARRYKLTENQKAKIQPILADQQSQVHTVGENETLSNTEWAAALRNIHQQTVLKIELEMTDTQVSKYIKDEAKRAKQSQDDQGDDGDGPPPDGGPGGGGPGGGGPPGD
jgi:hypothetical protein